MIALFFPHSYKNNKVNNIVNIFTVQIIITVLTEKIKLTLKEF